MINGVLDSMLYWDGLLITSVFFRPDAAFERCFFCIAWRFFFMMVHDVRVVFGSFTVDGLYIPVLRLGEEVLLTIQVTPPCFLFRELCDVWLCRREVKGKWDEESMLSVFIRTWLSL